MPTLKQDGYNRLTVSLAYLAVVFIWSTTPITIKWSSEGTGYLFGLLLRMGIGALLATMLVLIVYKHMPLDRKSCKAYLAAALALFGGMMPVYWGAQYISSGLISVIFGLSPMVTGYLAWRYIEEQGFSTMKVIGSMSGIGGLLVIFSDDIVHNNRYIYGILAVLFAVLLHAISAVWIKSIRVNLPALTLVSGGLIFTLPMFGIMYLIISPGMPDAVPVRAIWSIIYLGVIGSVLGFVCYYYLLKRLAASTVALITLITPVLALYIGHVFNNESITAGILAGTLFVLCGLAIHQWGDLLLKRLFR